MCGGSQCRTVEVGGTAFETIPERLFLKAALVASSRLLDLNTGSAVRACRSVGEACSASCVLETPGRRLRPPLFQFVEQQLLNVLLELAHRRVGSVRIIAIDHDTADLMAITGLSVAAHAHAVTDRAKAEISCACFR